MFIKASLFLTIPLLASAAPAPFFRFDVVNTTLHSGSRHKTTSFNHPSSGNCSLPDGGTRKEGCQVVRNCVGQGQVAVTYDDGMFEYEEDVARTFGNESKATFFLNGDSESLLFSPLGQSYRLLVR
jgi:hypothetical protein